MRRLAVCLLAAALVVPVSSRAQTDLHVPFDKILDTYVRDGFVYYLALQKTRAPLDRYIASLDVPRAQVDGWTKPNQEAFWLNAYDALVMRTVINAYPIKGKSPDFPPKSIRQIPGAFDVVQHRVGGQLLTLDEIEKNVISKFGDARMRLALGRGAVGSGRLRSEAYEGATLEQQLESVVAECASRVSCVKVDRDKNVFEVTPLVSWGEDDFVRSFAAAGESRWGNRTPVERAAAAMVYPHLFQSEQEVLAANTFKMTYGQFDWRLNDLTGGLPE